jgi:hypothetical protein
MPLGLSVAIALSAQAAGAPAAAAPPAPIASPANGPGPPLAAKPPPKAPVLAKPADSCRTAPPSAEATEIVVCAERPQGYRLNPDVMAAKRGARSDVRGKPTAHMKDTGCASVGPAGCIGAAAGVNLVGAALTAVEMAAKLARGESIGEMFVTTPESTEYERYVAAKRRREAAEAEAAALAAAKAKAAAAPSDAVP